MIGITILDRGSTGALLPTLYDLLTLLHPWASELLWTGSDIEAVGIRAAPLHKIDSTGEDLPYEKLLQLAKGGDQIIDGEFVGRAPAGAIQMKIRAVDSTAWDVEASEADVIGVVERAFKRTRRF